LALAAVRALRGRAGGFLLAGRWAPAFPASVPAAFLLRVFFAGDFFRAGRGARGFASEASSSASASAV
jgi:hypothetical protein